MIISDSHRFVFIHIPKCAGTSVKGQLAHLDERGGRYSRVEPYPGLGSVDLTHLQLCVLKRIFPSEYECVQSYNSFALCRDPFERFLSALLQRVMAYESLRRETFSRRDLHKEIGHVMEYLAATEIVRDHQYIHFEKQTSYVFLDGKKIVDNVFAIHNIGRFYEAVREYTGCEFDGALHLNQSLYARNAAIRILIEGLWPMARRVLPASIADLRHHVKKFIYTPSRDRLGDVLDSREVREFIEAYYAKDLELFHASG